jgi:hypothetical protein
MMLRIDTSWDNSMEKYTCYAAEAGIVGGLSYNTMTQAHGDDMVNQKKEIITRREFEDEEKRILADIATHYNTLAELRSEARLVNNVIELTKRDSVKYTTDKYAEVTKYSLNTLLFNKLLEQPR